MDNRVLIHGCDIQFTTFVKPINNKIFTFLKNKTRGIIGKEQYYLRNEQ